MKPVTARIMEAGELAFNDADPDPKAEPDVFYSPAMIIKFDSRDDLRMAIHDGIINVSWDHLPELTQDSCV